MCELLDMCGYSKNRSTGVSTREKHVHVPSLALTEDLTPSLHGPASQPYCEFQVKAGMKHLFPNRAAEMAIK